MATLPMVMDYLERNKPKNRRIFSQGPALKVFRGKHGRILCGMAGEKMKMCFTKEFIFIGKKSLP